MITDKGLAAGMGSQMVVELLLSYAAVVAAVEGALEGLEARVILHVAVQVVLCAKRIHFVAAEPAALVVAVGATIPNKSIGVLFDMCMEVVAGGE